MTPTARTTALVIALGGCAFSVLAHVAVLEASGQNALTTPVGALSTGPYGAWHGAGIVAFALAHVALGALLGANRTGPLRLVARVALVLAAAALLWVAATFAWADPARFASGEVSDRLPVPASLVGAAMGFLLPGLWRTQRGAAWFDGACFAFWMVLTALVLLVDPAWVGAYERLVGATYVVWVAGMAWFSATGPVRPRGSSAR